jgi:hypothetical protein
MNNGKQADQNEIKEKMEEETENGLEIGKILLLNKVHQIINGPRRSSLSILEMACLWADRQIHTISA